MKIKVSEATGPVLDYMVAKVEGLRVGFCCGKPCYFIQDWEGDTEYTIPTYSIDWAQGGPIIEREKIGVYPSETHEGQWAARTLVLAHIYGPTPLIAAMRCCVASKLGEEVEVPDELAKENSHDKG